MPGSVICLFIRAVVFSISAILDFKVTASGSADAMASISFLKVSLNSWVINDVACFTFDVIVFPAAVETPIDSSPGGYTSPPIRELLSPRREISYPSGSIERDAPQSSGAS